MWYEAWGNLPVEVRLATWERDRIGYFEAMRGDGGHLVTCPLAGATEFSANVGGLGPYTELRFELLDEGFHPLPGFSGADAAVLTELEGAGEGEEDLVPGQESRRMPRRSPDCASRSAGSAPSPPTPARCGCR